MVNEGLQVSATTARMKGMRYFLAFSAVTFVILALLHVPHPSPYLWLPYAAAAILAILTLVPRLQMMLSRILAIAATALMFFLFAGFFMDVPKLEADWYQSQEGWAAVSRLLAAFLLIPLLSEFSCRCKADCREARTRGRHSRQGFFSAPDQSRIRSS
jgi:dolichyl-phosphate-mannose--protein O-mannosyl transferase